MASVGIIGAGIAGLTAAYVAQQEGHDVRVFEASCRSGGMIRSEWHDGYLLEHGPNLLRPRPSILPTLLRDLNLTDDIVPTNEAASTRYIVRDGTPTPLPQSLWSLVTTDLFSTRAKLRLLAEPFIGAASTEDESVASFARRRLGTESLDYAVNPVVGGTFAGDPERLSVRHAFETLYTREREHGSLLRGALHASRMGTNGTHVPDLPSGPFSFRNGLETLPRALTEAIGPRIEYGAPVTAVRAGGPVGGFRVTTSTGETATTRTMDAVICTAPLHRIPSLGLDASVDCAPLNAVPYPPVGVLNLGFKRADVAHPLDGFGLLVPEAEAAFHILGTIFSSTLFPRRAPDDHVLLTTFVGGMRNEAFGTKATSELLPVVHRDLDALLGLRGAPTCVHHVTLSHALPQYTLDHGHVQATLDALEAEHPGLFFAGNYRDGISVGSAMASGATAARRVKEA